VFGKLLGFIIGFALGLGFGSLTLGIVLGCVGLVVGHLLDARNAERLRGERSDLEEPLFLHEPEAATGSMLARDLCTLFIEIARADTAVSRLEVRAIRGWFEANVPNQMQQVPAFLKSAIAQPSEEISTLCQRIQEADGGPDREALLEALYAVAEADGPLNGSEREALREAARSLGLKERTVEEPEFQEPELSLHFAALGVPQDATNEEIKGAYRRLAREHHPDRAAHQGPEAVAAASARFRAIHEAYETLKRQRGF
jgi:DnaJ like chaperone protein